MTAVRSRMGTPSSSLKFLACEGLRLSLNTTSSASSCCTAARTSSTLPVPMYRALLGVGKAWVMTMSATMLQASHKPSSSSSSCSKLSLPGSKSPTRMTLVLSSSSIKSSLHKIVSISSQSIVISFTFSSHTPFIINNVKRQKHLFHISSSSSNQKGAQDGLLFACNVLYDMNLLC